MFLPTATDIMNPACLSSVVRSTLPTFNSAFQLFRTNTKTRLLEVGRYVGKTSIVLPISIYQYRYRIGTLDIGFQYIDIVSVTSDISVNFLYILSYFFRILTLV